MTAHALTPPGPCPPAPARPRRATAWRAERGLAAGLLLGALLGLGAAPAARAQDTLTLSFSGGQIFIPPGSSQVPAGVGPADPYPSTIDVTGIPDDHVVVDLEVVLVRLTHRFADHLDILLVAPNGQSTILLSDVRGLYLDEATIRLRDDAAPVVDLEDTGGTYAPTDIDDPLAPDHFPSPAPASGWGTALAPLTQGPVNGAWRLFAVDDSMGDVGVLDNWALVFRTQSVFVDSPFPPVPGPTPPIPEPGTWALMALGLAALAARRRQATPRAATSGPGPRRPAPTP